MGKTPNRYLTDCRLAKAKLLLVSTGLSIAQVATQSGFAQSSYFIKVFRRFEGMSPVKYLRGFWGVEDLPSVRRDSILVSWIYHP